MSAWTLIFFQKECLCVAMDRYSIITSYTSLSAVILLFFISAAILDG